MPQLSPGRRLREAVADVTIQIPGAFNALVARMAEDAGFDAVYLSGAALSAGTLALPDVGLFSLTELATQASYITRRVQIPLIVDADTGFGGAVNVERTVRELEAAGVAAIQLEDQELPKRCGHLSGKRLVEPGEMCAKLRAAVAARQDSDLVILARTDAASVTGIDEAIDRAKRYLEAGADWIFPEALASRGDFERFAQAIECAAVGEYDRVREKSAAVARGVGRFGLCGSALSSHAVTCGDEGGRSGIGHAGQRRHASRTARLDANAAGALRHARLRGLRSPRPRLFSSSRNT